MDPVNEDSGGPAFNEIKPARPKLTAGASGPAAGSAGQASPRSRNLALKAAVGVLLLSAAAVIFVLPQWVEPPDVSSPAATPEQASPSPAKAAPAAAPAPADTPWQRTQEAELRKESQDVLARLLETRETLVEKGVQTWAPEAFQSALQHAEAGDQNYSRREFQQAHADYLEADRQLSALIDRVEPLYEESMEQGNRALEEGDEEQAKAAFDLALAIDSLDRAAALGRERAETVDEVFARIDQGDQLLEAGELEAAEAVYREALDIDSHSVTAREKLGAARSRITDREFNRAMSAGFAALEQGRLDQARQSFAAAQNLKPGSRETQNAVAQTDARIKANRIHALLAEAEQLEIGEQWRQAQARYESALELDSGLSVARDGKEAAATRAAVHEKLQGMLAEPQRLYDENVYQEAVAFQSRLRRISSPGPVLERQLDELDAVLEKARTPVVVRLLSDNQTRVTVYKVAELGMFESMKLDLLPGRYVAAGYREGYQDVRREFFVDPDKPIGPITIQADEKIALGN